MTPQEIAREIDWHQLAAAHFGYIPGAELAKTDKEVLALASYLKEQAPTLILSAAAKMVRESGAVEALAESNQLLDEAAEPDTNSLAAEWDRVACARVRSNVAALTALRALTEQAGKPQ